MSTLSVSGFTNVLGYLGECSTQTPPVSVQTFSATCFFFCFVLFLLIWDHVAHLPLAWLRCSAWKWEEGKAGGPRGDWRLTCFLWLLLGGFSWLWFSHKCVSPFGCLSLWKPGKWPVTCTPTVSKSLKWRSGVFSNPSEEQEHSRVSASSVLFLLLVVFL